jgi:hypothetical protein
MGAGTVFIDGFRGRPSYFLSVEECLAQTKRCRNEDVLGLKGALAPETLRSSKECAAEFGLQSPGGVSSDMITVCADRVLLRFDARERALDVFLHGCQPGVDFYAAHGYLLLQVWGRFDGDTFRADDIGVEACDEVKVYRWLFGSPEAIESRSKQPEQ